MSKPNRGINFGHSSRLGYDSCAYTDKLEQSVSPLLFNLDPSNITNCNSCLSVFGPRGGHNSVGVSTLNKINTTAPAQGLVDLESILTNRNVLQSKCKDGRVNPIDVTKFSVQHARVCNDYLDPISSHLTNPPSNYREMGINRFFDLPLPAQVNIYWDNAINTQLEAKDNYYERVPRTRGYDATLPRPIKGRNQPCKYVPVNNTAFTCGM